MSALKISLLIGGVVFEFLGIILIAFPDISPYLVRFSRWLRKHTRVLLDRVRHLLGRPRVVAVEARSAGVSTVGGRASMIRSVSAIATLEEKVGFLLTRDREAQRDVSALREQIADFEKESSKRLDESRREIEAGFERRLATEREEYRPLRILGVFALVVGLACATLANFAN